MKDLPKIGFMLLRSMADYVDDLAPHVDFFQLTTDDFFGDETLEEKHFMRYLTESYNVHIHNLDLSICSGDTINRKALDKLRAITQEYRISTISDHIGFNSVNGNNIGLPILPPILTKACLNVSRKNIDEIMASITLPFYIENNSNCLQWPHSEMTDTEFINGLVGATMCDLLLDLPNLLADARNYLFSANDYIDKLNYAKIKMIHIAGGDWLDGFTQGIITGGHNKPVESEVWELLSYTLSRADAEYIVLERSRKIVLSEVIDDLKQLKQTRDGLNR